MQKILFVTTVYRCGEKVYPILEHLSQIYEVDVLLFNQMSLDTPWAGESDPRNRFIKYCHNNNIRTINGPNYNTVKKFRSNGSLLVDKSNIDLPTYKLAIIDDNLNKEHYGTTSLYKRFNKYSIPVIACPHGNRDFDSTYDLDSMVGSSFDYSFVFGEKEKSKIGKVNKKKLIPAGIPSNDKLKLYKRNKDYILLISGYENVEAAKKSNSYAITSQFLYDSGLIDFCKKEDLKLVIKRKTRFPFKHNFDDLVDSLKKEKQVIFVNDVKDDNKLICDSKYVISPPSTLAFKSIQKGIKTVVLKDFGMLGNFYDFEHLVDHRGDFVKILSEGESYNYSDFLKETLSGSIEYNSTHLYCDFINGVINGKA